MVLRRAGQGSTVTHGAVSLQGWTPHLALAAPVTQSHTAGWQGVVSAAGLCLMGSGSLLTRDPRGAHCNSTGFASRSQTVGFWL